MEHLDINSSDIEGFAESSGPSEELRNVIKLTRKRGGKRSAVTKTLNKLVPAINTLSNEDKLNNCLTLKKSINDLESLNESITDSFVACEEFTTERLEALELSLIHIS